MRTANYVKKICNITPTAQATIDTALTKLMAVQLAEKCFLLDMKRAVVSAELLVHEICWYVVHKFKTHFPIPEFWADEHPTVVVLWRALQKQQLLADACCQWAMSHRLHTWTDVNETTIFSFFEDLQVFLLGVIAFVHRALPLSLSLWTTLNRVFGCTVCWEGLPLNPETNVSAPPTEDLKPFTVPPPQEPQTYCVYPRLTQYRQGNYPYACWDCSNVIDFLHSPLSPLNRGLAKAALVVIPTVSTARCIIDDKRARGTAVLIASHVQFKKMYLHWPHSTFCDEPTGQWWWMVDSPEKLSTLCVCPHDFVKLFRGLMRKHGAVVHLPPPTVVQVSMYSHSLSKHFQYVMKTENQVRAQGLRAKWNFKTRHMNTRFDWSTIPRSSDTVNRSIQWSNCKVGRLIHMWRMTDHTVSEVGSWIYALWIPGVIKYILARQERVGCTGASLIVAVNTSSRQGTGPCCTMGKGQRYLYIPLSTTRRTESTFFVRQK